MARPRKEIDIEQFKKLCGIQCTLTEIAGFFDCSEDTIENWCKRTFKAGFSETYKKYSVSGRISLRRSQFKLAEKSTAMSIWLGKQYLGQTEKIVTESRADGMLADLIEGLKCDDIYAETKSLDEALANE